MTGDAYITMTDYSYKGATIHIKAYGADIASFYITRDALNDFAERVRKADITNKYR